MEHGKPSSVTESQLDYDAVCQKVRAAVEPARTHAVSLHDEAGDVLWLSESTMGPDEHNAVREALETFSNIDGPAVLAYDLGDSRSAVLLRAVNARRVMVGAVMMIMDSRAVKQDDRGVVRLMTPRLQRALSDFATMRPDAAPLPELTLATASGTPPLVAAAAAAAQGKPIASASTGSTSARMLPPLELSLADSVRISTPKFPAPVADIPAAPAAPQKLATRAVTPEIDRLHAALRRSPIALHVQRLVPLTKGSQLKRYEVLLRSKSEEAPKVAPQAMLKAAVENGLGSMIDRRVVTELIGWLVHHPEAWRAQAVMLSVNLTTTALHDEHFIKFVELCLAKSSLPKSMIAFEIDAPTAVKMGDKISDIATSLHRLGCPVVLDDFGLRTECFDLLRLPAVRYIKLAPQITDKMRSDKLSQAAITAVVQMARVLGMHTVAKRTETAAAREWLTALGVDFIQSNALSPAAPIDTLAKPAEPKP